MKQALPNEVTGLARSWVTCGRLWAQEESRPESHLSQELKALSLLSFQALLTGTVA